MIISLVTEKTFLKGTSCLVDKVTASSSPLELMNLLSMGFVSGLPYQAGIFSCGGDFKYNQKSVVYSHNRVATVELLCSNHVWVLLNTGAHWV